MKTNFLLGMFTAIALSITTVSCSSDDSKESDETDNTLTSTKYQHKVLIEDATGTWCQFCPRVSYAIQQAKANNRQGENVIAVAIHSGAQGYPDLMQIKESNTLNNLFRDSYELDGFPFGLINRTVSWNYPEPNNLAQVFNMINQEGSTTGIKISSILTKTEGTVDVTFKFSQNFTNLKYSIFIIENEVVTPTSPQKNSTGYFNGEGANFIHNDVLRGVSGTVTGNSLGDVKVAQEITKANQSVSYKLLNDDLSKVEVVVFVTDSSGKVLNVQSAHANSSKNYEIVKE